MIDTKKLPEEMSDDELAEVIEMAEAEVEEWKMFLVPLSVEQEKRKKETCEHDFQAIVDYEERCFGHVLYWRETELGNYWLETCEQPFHSDDQCMSEQHTEPKPWFKSMCRKCNAVEVGIARVDPKKQML